MDRRGIFEEDWLDDRVRGMVAVFAGWSWQPSRREKRVCCIDKWLADYLEGLHLHKVEIVKFRRSARPVDHNPCGPHCYSKADATDSER